MPGNVILINVETQTPENVPAEKAAAALASQKYREYKGSYTNVQQGIGGDTAVGPTDLGPRLGMGATQTHSEASLAAAARAEATLDAHDTFGNKILAGLDGAIETTTGGLMKGLPALDEAASFRRDMRGEANPHSKTAGSIAAIAATVLAPGSALRFTPLGAAVRLGEGAGAAIKAGGGAARIIAGEAASGAVMGGVLGATNQIGNAIIGRPVSGDAIIDDLGLGAVVGGALGGAGVVVGRMAGKIKSAKTELEAAGRFADTSNASQAALKDGLGTWETAHLESVDRIRMLGQMEKEGWLDAEIAGSDWLAVRREAAKTSTAARERLLKISKADDMQGVMDYAGHVMAKGNGKQVSRFARALDEYGEASSNFHTAMRPTSADQAYFSELSKLDGWTTEAIPAAGHPMQRYAEMVERGAPEAELRAFAEANSAKDASGRYGRYELADSTPMRGRTANNVSPEIAKAETVPPTPQGMATGKASPGRRAAKEIGHKDVTPEVELSPQIEGPGIGGKWNTPPRFATQGIAKGNLQGGSLKEVIGHPGALEDVSRLKGALRARDILDQAGAAKSPFGTGEVGKHLEQVIAKLESSTGGRLGTAEARELAAKLGARGDLNGALAQKVVDMWALKKLSEAMGKVATKTGKASKLEQALYGGMLSKAKSMARAAGGPFAGGAVGAFLGGPIGGIVGAALGSTSGLAAAAGRFKDSAVKGLETALRPGMRTSVTAFAAKPSSVSYDDSEPTKNFELKSTQLHNLVGNAPAMRERIGESMKELTAFDPITAAAATETAVRRIQNLALKVPVGVSRGMLKPLAPPSVEEVEMFEQYEAVTHNKEMVHEYLKAGSMPDSVASAMREQHPDYLNEMREYVITHQDEVAKAPQKTLEALSKLIGVPLVPEADPLYLQRQQQQYKLAKEKASQNMAAQQGMNIMGGGAAAPMMTLGQQFQLPIKR